MRNLVVIAFFTISIFSAYTQSFTLRGTLVCKSEPLEYASVVVKNTTLGTTTNLDGKFEITLSDTTKFKIIKFSCVGYETQEYQIGAENNDVLIEMKESPVLLPEVVVVDYSTNKDEIEHLRPNDYYIINKRVSSFDEKKGNYWQVEKMFGRWITPQCDFISIKQSDNRTITADFCATEKCPRYRKSCARHDESNLLYQKCSNDTLQFYKCIYFLGGKQEMQKYDFKIISLSDISMTLIPISHFSRKFFAYSDTLRFIRQEYAIRKIHFQKLEFSIFSFGSDVLEIDSVGNVCIETTTLINDSTYEIKYFKGKLKRSLFKEMANLLQTSNIETLDWGSYQHWSDTFETSLKINYNGKQKHFFASKPSPISQPLIDFLMNIKKQVRLKETKYSKKYRRYGY